MKREKRTLSVLVTVLISISMILGLNQTARADSTILISVGQTRQILLGASLVTGKLTSGSWSSSDSRVAQITSQSAGVCDVLGVSSGTATITCRYKYYVGGTYVTSSWSCPVRVLDSGSSSGGGSSSEYTLYFCEKWNGSSWDGSRNKSITLDLAGKEYNSHNYISLFTYPDIMLGFDPIVQEWYQGDYYLSIDVTNQKPGIISYDESYTSRTGDPVFLSSTVDIKAKKVGIEVIRFQVVRIQNKVFYDTMYTQYGQAELEVQVMCSHVFGEGVAIQPATDTQNEVLEYTCKYCGETKEVEILPDAIASASDNDCVYDGLAHGITVSVTEPKTGATIRYGTTEGTYDLDTSPTIININESPLVVYYEVTAEGYKEKTGSATVTIRKASISPDVILNGWTYGENPNEPSVIGNEGNGVVSLFYKEKDADDSTYTGTIPSLVGSYTVKAVIPETDNYKGGEATSSFTISKAQAMYTSKPTANVLSFSGKAQSLVAPGSAIGGTLYYAVTQSESSEPSADSYSTSIPTAINAGTYHVWYKVDGDANHKNVEADHVTVTISPVNKEALNDAIKAAEAYYDEIKDNADYAAIAETLKKAIDAAKALSDNANATEDQVSAALSSVTEAEKTAKVAEEAAAKQAADEAVAKAVADVIQALSDSAGLGDKDAVAAARAAYDALTEEQKRLIPGDLLSRLSTAEQQVAVAEEAARTVDISACKITVKDLAYTGKAIKKPTVTVTYDGQKLKEGTDYSFAYNKKAKAIGVYNVTVTGMGRYTGFRKATLKIVPKGTVFSKLTGGNKQVILKWKRQKNITGYQIEYSQKKDFSDSKKVTIRKANTLTTTIKKLKAGTKYYVRIRTYTTVKKKNYFSAWSKVKAVKTKAGKAGNGSVEPEIETGIDVGDMSLEIDEISIDEISLDDGAAIGDGDIIIDEVVEMPAE